MIYIVTNQNGKKSIQEWEIDLSHSHNFVPLNEQQLEFLAQNPNARVQEVEKCEIFSKYYFVFDQNNRKTIQVWEDDKRGNPQFVVFTQEQEDFYLQNPTATIWEVQNCKTYADLQSENVQPFDLATYKNEKIAAISKLSLQTLGRFISDYQLANAQCGVYDEAKSQQVIETYKVVGTQCRQLYYDFAEQVALCENKNEIDTLVEQYTKLYNNVCDR